MTSAQQPVAIVRQDDVKRDGILKEQVRREEQSKVLWEQRWKDLIKEFDKYRIEEAIKHGFTEEEYRNYRITKPGKKIMEVEGWKFEPSKEYPVTSSGMVGWRSSRLECSLERFGSLYTSPRFTIDPPDMPPEPPQKFIILG